jgi:hypothetical protein
MHLFLVLFGLVISTDIDLSDKLILDRPAGQFALLHTNLNEYSALPDTIYEIYHFHGATQVISEQFDRIDIPGTICNIHLGPFSSPYKIYFSDSTRFDQIISTVEGTLVDSLGISKLPARFRILTSFSAGYAAVREILKHPTYYDAIDAIILADGLHCNSDSARMKEQMGDFVRFARDAAAGEKIMLVTHSSINTSGYQSTTQTAQYLNDQVGIQSNSVDQKDLIGQAFIQYKKGDLYITGYRGDDGPSHMRHFYGIYILLNRLICLQNL